MDNPNMRYVDCWSNIYRKNFSGLEELVSDLWFENIYDYDEILQELIDCQNMVIEMETEYQKDFELELKDEVRFTSSDNKITKTIYVPSFSTSKYKYCYA